MNDQNNKLFSEFEPVSTSQWEEKIMADLKGGDYEKKLIWKTEEGIKVKPYYRSEDLDGLEYLSSLPGEKPFVRGTKSDNNKWIIRQDIYNENGEDANRIAVEATRKGADAVGLVAKNVTSHKQMQQLLYGIDLAETEINFISSRSYPLTLELFLYEIEHRGITEDKIRGSLNFDPTGYLLLHGDFYVSRQGNMDEAGYLVQTVSKRIPGFHAITVNGQLFHNAGATSVQELAFSLASGHEYLHELVSKGIPAAQVADSLRFSFGIGSNYFLGIARLRAARLLWSAIAGQYLPGNPEKTSMFIHSTTSMWNKTLYDPYVNLLRTTTEGMAAAIGNTDSMTILPFDFPFREESEISRRIARNQQLILKEEASLDKIVDPAAGSYYIESLTGSIATHTWDLFLKIEEKGGMTECIKSGFVQDEIENACRKKDMDIAQRRIVFLGTNQYPNPLENIAGNIIKPLESVNETNPVYRKLKIYRGAQPFEELRLATEKAVSGGISKPSVFMFTIGNPAMRKARAAFACNFFGCAGYSINDNPGFKTVEEGAEYALRSKSGIIVICSSDEEYPSLAPSIVDAIRKENTTALIIVAGYPKDQIEALKAAGIDDFIHVKTNVLDFLKNIQRKLGII